MEIRAKKQPINLAELCEQGDYDLDQQTTWWNNIKEKFDPWSYFEKKDKRVLIETEVERSYTIPMRVNRDEFGNITRVFDAIKIDGHIDLEYLYEADGTGGVIDYKTTRRPMDEPDCIQDLRMVGYGLMTMDRYQLKQVTLTKIYPHDPENWYQQDVLDQSNVLERRKAYESAWKEAYNQAQLDPERRTYHPKSWGKSRCSYCPGAKRCPALRHELETLHTFMDPTVVSGEREPVGMVISEDVVRQHLWPMLERARLIGAWDRKCRDMIRDYVKEHGPVAMDDEHELRMSDGSRPSLRVMKK